MENNAKIVWFDDEYQTLENIILQFDEANISFEAFKDATQGIGYLEKHFEDIDAVIIDGNFFIDKDDVDIDTKGKALSNVLDCMQGLKHKKDTPYYVLSGKVNFRNREPSILEYKDIDKVYDKIKPIDVKTLCEKILEDASLNERRQMVNRYNDVFKIINSIEELRKHQGTLIDLLVYMDKGHVDFTLIRKILESLFVALSELRIIPDGFTKEKSWISGTSKFLSGIHDQYRFKNNEPIVHRCIGETLYRVLNITQDGSHSEGNLKFKVDEYHQSHASGYLYRSVVYALFEIIVYFGDFIKNNQDIDRNQEKWEIKQAISNSDNENWKAGVLIRVAENGYGTFQCDHEYEPLTIVPYFIKKYKLRPNQRLEVLAKFDEEQQKELIKEIKII